MFFKSKKSFYSDVAVAAQKNASASVRELSLFCLEKHLTPIFEYTSPDNEVVIDYGNDPKFVLLAIRDNITGIYKSPISCELIAAKFGVPVIQNFGYKSFDELKTEMASKTDFEGYVIEFPNGLRVKMKTDWYLRLHRCKTDLRERDVAKMFIDETLDDIKSAVTLAGLSLTPITDIENRISDEISNIIKEAKALMQFIKNEPSRKDAAMKYRNDPMFGLAMKLYDGAEPDYKKYWVKAYLSSYSLKTLYSNFKSGDSEE